MRSIFCFSALAALSAWQACAQQEVRQAMITGKSGGPKCTIEVEIDAVADVEIHGTTARLHTLAGGPAVWRRFECNVPMPAYPANFRFRGIDGRGRQTLIGEPVSSGVAVVRLEDPRPGREGYTFDLMWNGEAGPQPGPGYPQAGIPQPGYPPQAQPLPPGVRDRDHDGDRDRRFGREEAIRVCAESAQDQLRRNSFTDLSVLEVKMDDDAGRGDWIYGKLAARRGPAPETFGFACSVDFEARRVSPASIRHANDGYYGGGDEDINRFTRERAIRACGEAVQDRLRHDGFTDFEMRKVDVDDRPGNNDWIVGDLVARRGDGDRDRFEFSCSVDFEHGRLRSINVNRDWH